MLCSKAPTYPPNSQTHSEVSLLGSGARRSKCKSKHARSCPPTSSQVKCPQSPQAMHLQTIPWVGFADNSDVHSFNKYLPSPYYVLKQIRFAFPRTLPTTRVAEAPSIDSITLSCFSFTLEEWKDNSGLGQSSTRCLGKKPPGIRQESHMVAFHTSFRGLWLHLWPWNPQLFPQRPLGS